MAKLIEGYYQRIQITSAHREALAGMLHHEFDQLTAAETDELDRLTTRRDRLQHEQERLLQVHYADAIALSLLKREQDRSKSTGASTPTTASTPTPEPTSTTP